MSSRLRSVETSFFVCVSLPKCSNWLWKNTFVHFFFIVHLSCSWWFNDISVWYSYICSLLILRVELCGSSLEDCPLHGNSGNSVFRYLFCWRRHVTWWHLLLNVLAIFMVEDFYIYAVVHFFSKWNEWIQNQSRWSKLEYQNAVTCVIRCLDGVKILNSMLKIKTLVRSLLLSLYLICNSRNNKQRNDTTLSFRGVKHSSVQNLEEILHLWKDR